MMNYLFEEMDRTYKCREEESWRRVDGFPNYEVSDLGRFRKTSGHRSGFLRGTVNGNGYIHIGFTKDGVQQKFLANRIVALHFLPDPQPGMVVDHIDGNRKNNRADNLEWVSKRENYLRSMAYDSFVRRNGLDKKGNS